MKSSSFLPQWYLEDKRDKNRKIIKLCIMIVIVVNIILINLLLVNLNKVKILETSINEKNLYKKENFLNENKGSIKNCRTLSTLTQLNETMTSNIPFKSICIANEKVNMQISEESFDYISFVKHIEQESKFTIKNLTLPDEQNNESVKIYLELK